MNSIFQIYRSIIPIGTSVKIIKDFNPLNGWVYPHMSNCVGYKGVVKDTGIVTGIVTGYYDRYIYYNDLLSEHKLWVYVSIDNIGESEYYFPIESIRFQDKNVRSALKGIEEKIPLLSL